MKKIIVKGFPNWEKVIVDLLLEANFDVSIMKNKSDIPLIFKNLNIFNFIFIFFSKKWLQADYVYFVGVINLKFLKLAKLFNKKVICHWIGTDVTTIAKLPEKQKKNFIKLCKKTGNKHFAITPKIVQKLQEYGIESELLEITSNNVLPQKKVEFSKKHSILAYWSPLKREFYGGNVIDKLAIDFPELTFYILGSDGNGETQLSNLVYLNKVKDIEEVFDKITILIRITKHDGLPSMILETLARGKWVIFSDDFPHTIKAQTYFEAKEALTKLQLKTELNIEGMKYIENNYNSQIIKEKIMNAFSIEIK